MSWRISLGQNVGHFRTCKPRRQTPATIEIVFAHLCTRDRRRLAIRWYQRTFLIFSFGRQVDKFAEWNHSNAQLCGIFFDELLCLVWSIKTFAIGAHSRTGMIAPDDEMVCTVVAPDQSVPQSFAWS